MKSKGARNAWSGKAVKTDLAWFFYNLLLMISLPVAAIYFLWRILITGKSNESWQENLGALPRLCDRPDGKKLIWIHAVSVGEVTASLPIQDELRRLVPDSVILVTTITQTGNTVARKPAKSADAVAYLPLDYPPFVSRALNRVKPDAVVIVEAEFWPNFLSAAKRRGISTVLVNGRFSDRSLQRGRRWHWLMSWATSNIDFFCMQTETDAERIRSLGARPESVRVFGSTKFDQEGAQLSPDEVAALRKKLNLPDGAPVFVAGSTNPGEDEPVLDAFLEMRKDANDLKLIIAPRQIERGDEIRALAEARGLRCAKRSGSTSSLRASEEMPADFDALILDTFGELATAYATSEIAFVGGTLIPKGGHSLFQPVLQGKPVLFGPHTFKTRDMAQMVIEAGVGFKVKDAAELAARGRALLADPRLRAEIDSACRRLVAENRGASARCAELIAELIGRRE